MSDPVRPMYTFVLRLWHEPGTPPGDIGWRGQLRLLGARHVPEHKTAFTDLANLAQAIRDLLQEVSKA